MTTTIALRAPESPADATNGRNWHPDTPESSQAIVRLRASLLTDETATLAIVVHGLRALRPQLERAATIDALGTPASYRLAMELLDTLTGDLAAMLDRRDFADVDERRAA